MTYRDFSNRQLAKFRRDCHKAMMSFLQANPHMQAHIAPEVWEAAWSKAFISGVNQLESKYKKLGLFDIPTNENVKSVEGTTPTSKVP